MATSGQNIPPSWGISGTGASGTYLPPTISPLNSVDVKQALDSLEQRIENLEDKFEALFERFSLLEDQWSEIYEMVEEVKAFRDEMIKLSKEVNQDIAAYQKDHLYDDIPF